jgi:hypothetical protein
MKRKKKLETPRKLQNVQNKHKLKQELLRRQRD